MALFDSVYMSRLRQSLDESRRKMKVFRENRTELIRQFVGNHYSEDGSDEKVPLNFLELAIHIYSTHLISSNPSAVVNTMHQELKAQCLELEALAKYAFKQMNLGKTLQAAVRDALFCPFGIVKVGICEHYSGFDSSLSQPFADVVDFDDFVVEMGAKSIRHAKYLGHRYEIDTDEAAEMFGEELPSSDRTQYNEQGDIKVGTLSRGHTIDDSEFRQTVEVWDLWMPRDGVVLTMLGDGARNMVAERKPLRVKEWEGPKNGPLKLIGFEPVPGQLMPLPLGGLWQDVHELSNRLYCKVGRQADRSKNILFYRGEEEGERAKNAKDGDMVQSDDPKNVVQIPFNAIDEKTLALILQNKEWFSYLAGNLDALGGLGPQSDTLGQDKLVTESASLRMQSMQGTVLDFTEEVTSDIMWWLFNMPFLNVQLEKKIPGTEISLPFQMDQQSMQGGFFNFNFSVSPHSLKPRTPAEKLQTLGNFLMQIWPNLAESAMQMGIMLNPEGVLRTIQRYADMPEMEDYLIFAGPQAAPRPQGDGPRQPPVSHRSYTRHNQSTATSQGKDKAMMSMLMGGMDSLQSSEAQKVLSPTG